MATNDELVTTLKYQIDAQSRAALAEAEGVPDRVSASVGRLGKAHRKATAEEASLIKATKSLNKEFKTADSLYASTAKTASTLMAGFIGLGAIVGGTGAALYGFTNAVVDAAASANKLSNTAFTLQMSPEELQVMSQVYKELGASADSFIQDANRYQQLTGLSLTVDEIEKQYERVKNLSEREALNTLRAFGFTDDTARIIIEHGKNIRTVSNAVKDAGNFVTSEQIEALKNLDSASASLSATVGSLWDSMAAAAAPTITDGFNALNDILSGLAGNVIKLDTAVSQFNGKPFLENLKSESFDVQIKALDEMTARVEQMALLAFSDDAQAKVAEARKSVSEGYDKVGEAVLGEGQYRKLKKEADEGRHHFPEISQAMSLDEIAQAEMMAMGGERRLFSNTDENGRLTGQGGFKLFVRERVQDGYGPQKVDAEYKDLTRAAEEQDLSFAPDLSQEHGKIETDGDGKAQYELPPTQTDIDNHYGGNVDNSSAKTMTVTNHVQMEVKVESSDMYSAGAEIGKGFRDSISEQVETNNLGTGFGP